MNATRFTAAVVLSLAVAGQVNAQSGPREVRAGGDYDYARVIRVDPIIDSGRYGDRVVTTSPRCYYRDADDGYVRGGGYDDGYYSGGYRDDRYRDDRYRDGGHEDDGYGYRRYGDETGRTVATVIGGIAGAVLGSKVGDGGGRYVGSAVGSMVGGMAGRSIYDSAQRDRRSQRGTVRVCEPVSNDDGGHDGYDAQDDGRVLGYDVTYEYAGRTYHTRTNHHPGDRIRVRVDVRPE